MHPFLRHHWKTILGGLSLLTPVWQGIRWTLDAIGRIDVIQAHSGSIQIMIEYLTAPPISSILVVLGLLLIWLDQRARTVTAPVDVPTLAKPQTAGAGMLHDTEEEAAQLYLEHPHIDPPRRPYEGIFLFWAAPARNCNGARIFVEYQHLYKPGAWAKRELLFLKNQERFKVDLFNKIDAVLLHSKPIDTKTFWYWGPPDGHEVLFLPQDHYRGRIVFKPDDGLPQYFYFSFRPRQKEQVEFPDLVSQVDQFGFAEEWEQEDKRNPIDYSIRALPPTSRNRNGMHDA